MSTRRTLSVLGSTGTIGQNTLRIVDQFPERFQVEVLTAGRNLDLLYTQIERYRPTAVCVQDAASADTLRSRFPRLAVFGGESGLVDVVREFPVDVVIVGIVGFAALAPTLEAVRTGRTIGLANKESLVVAGPLLQEERKRHSATIVPVDSEHNAIFQALEGRPREDVQSIVLTASGGPLLRRPEIALRDVTPELAVAHPNWKMGPKISVDSATMMNKGLEVIEACSLFAIPESQIEVWVHPQSIVHGAVWLRDGSCLAHLSVPDMRASIGLAMSYPERLTAVVPKLSFAQMAKLEFLEPDPIRFPCLGLARQALRQGASHLIVLNAVNEIAVEAFLNRKIRYDQIPAVVERVLHRHSERTIGELADIFEVDRLTRQQAATSLQN